MPDSFYEIIPKQTDKELQEYISNYRQYTKEAIEFAIKEMKKRGLVIPEEEHEKILKGLEQRDQSWAKENEEDNEVFSPNWKKNIVTDLSAPELYSRHALSTFCLFLSPLFGSILFAINLKILGKMDFIFPIIVFGLLLTSASLLFVQSVIKLSMTINMIGAMFFYSYFWNRYIGKGTKYRVKSIVAPLIIGILLSIYQVLVIIKLLSNK